MPGPGIARDRPARGTFRDAATAGTPAAVRLRDGIDGWRRRIRRRRSAAAARLWSLIALGAALAGVTAGHLDGSMLVTALAAAALPFGAGVVSVVKRRRVCAEDAARELDAAFGFDEQVATALCCMAAGTAVGGGTTEHDRLVAGLIERAAALVAEAGGAGRSRPGLAYGEWAAMAVTAAAVAAVAAVPGSHPRTLTTASGGPGRAGLAAGATAPRPEHRGRVIPGNAGHRTAPTASGASAAGPAAGIPRRAATGTGRDPAAATGTPIPNGSVPASGAKAGARAPSPGKALSPTAPGASGASAGGGRSGTGTVSGSGPHGLASPAPGQAQTPRSPATQSPTTQSPATQSPATRSPATQSQTTRAAMTPHGGMRSATAQRAAGSRGTAARTRGVPGGDAAGTEPGANRRSARPAQPLPSAGNTVLVIVLSGGNGTVTAPNGQAAQAQPEGNGGTITATQAATAPGNTAEYVPPDQNEVPFPDQGMLGRYF